VTKNLDFSGETSKSSDDSRMNPKGESTKLEFGLFKGLMEPVSAEEWERADEEIRANWNPGAKWPGEE